MQSLGEEEELTLRLEVEREKKKATFKDFFTFLLGVSKPHVMISCGLGPFMIRYHVQMPYVSHRRASTLSRSVGRLHMIKE